jgi:AraC-like DNA-binding protein
MPARTCSRALYRAALAPARSFLRAARVIRAYHYLRGSSDRVADVAARLGYGSPDALVRDTRDVTGCRPTALVHSVRPDALVAIVADRLTRPSVACLPHYAAATTGMGSVALGPTIEVDRALDHV